MDLLPAGLNLFEEVSAAAVVVFVVVLPALIGEAFVARVGFVEMPVAVGLALVGMVSFRYRQQQVYPRYLYYSFVVWQVVPAFVEKPHSFAGSVEKACSAVHLPIAAID